MFIKRRNTVQFFLRNLIRLVVIVPLLILFVVPNFRNLFDILSGSEPGNPVFTFLIGIGEIFIIFWVGNLLAKMVYVLPQWERLILLRLGKSVGARGPGAFLIPPFIYEVANIIDVRISTYEVKAPPQSNWRLRIQRKQQ